MENAAGAKLLLVRLEVARIGLGKVLIVALLGLFLRVQVVEVAEELVEAVHGRQVLVAVTEVVLAEMPGAVAGLLQHLGERGRCGLQAELVAWHADRGHAGADRILTRDERRTARSA